MYRPWVRPKLSTKKEIVIGFVLATIVAILCVTGVVVGNFYEATKDTEIWNGKVTGKTRDRVSCKHSYSCNCRQVCSGSGNSRSCSTVCDTCYEHSYDIEWNVRSTIGTFEIDTLDRQGLKEPPRWTHSIVNEPVAVRHTFTNYIKGAKNNVLNREGQKITYPMPQYPDGVYDYYRINRVISVDSKVQNLQAWNAEVSNILRDLGPVKQVNLILVFTKYPQEYAEQLAAHWLGGKKNDVVLVVGTTDGVKADWAHVISWSKREDFKVMLRDAIVEKELTPAVVSSIVSPLIYKHFDRREFSEFKYLSYEIDLGGWWVVFAIIGFLLPYGVYIFAWVKGGWTWKN